MDVHSGKKYPAAALSNFARHAFILDDVEIASMEGFLQGLKFKNPDMQKEICKLSGMAAKNRGSKKNWKTKQKLYWQGEEIMRDSKGYQDLLDRAYFECCRQSTSFRKALLASGKANLTHSIGRSKINETVLTEREFCSKLMHIRSELLNNPELFLD